MPLNPAKFKRLVGLLKIPKKPMIYKITVNEKTIFETSNKRKAYSSFHESIKNSKNVIMYELIDGMFIVIDNN